MTFYIIKCIKFDTWLPWQRIFPYYVTTLTCPSGFFQEAQDVGSPKIYGKNCHPSANSKQRL